MSKLVTTSNFLNYPINTKYQIKQLNMKDIYLALAHARDRINRPLATRYTVSLNNDHSFDIKKLLCTRQISQNPYPIRILPS